MSVLNLIAFPILAIAALYGFFIGVYSRYQYLRLGQHEDRSEPKSLRVKSFLKYVLGQAKVLAEPAGIGHFFIFWGWRTAWLRDRRRGRGRVQGRDIRAGGRLE